MARYWLYDQGMAFNFDKLEQDIGGVVHNLLNDARQNEPALEAAVANALLGFGAPGAVADGAQALVGALLGHFQAKAQEAQAAADAAAQAQQEQPSS